MRVLQYKIPPDWDGSTVEAFAKRKLGFSHRMLVNQKHNKEGILRNGLPCRTVDLLREGDILSFTLPEEQGRYAAKESDLFVIWENEDFLIVDKPSDMPVHPSPGHDRDSLLNAVTYYYEKTGQRLLFRPLYRLDKDTSGLVVLGKHRAAVSSSQIRKTYFGVCQGSLKGSGTVDIPIGLGEESKIVRVCGRGDPAVTHWQALKETQGHTLLAFQLETGRTHQIRAHMAYLGHPLAGDDLYGGSLKVTKRQALHCGVLSLSCEALEVNRSFTSEFPQDMRNAFPWLPFLNEID